MIITKKLKLLFLCSFLFVLCKPATAMDINTPTIVAGTGKITGRLITPDGINKDSIFVNITVPHPISGDLARYETLVERSGKFSLDFDVETDTFYIGLYFRGTPYKPLMIKSINGGVTHIDIAYNSDLDIKTMEVTPAMNQPDMGQSLEVFSKMIDHRASAPKPLYDRSP